MESQPITLHRKQWMAKAIYTVKIELFYKLTASELQGILHFNWFVVLFYVSAKYHYLGHLCFRSIDNEILMTQKLQKYDAVQKVKTSLSPRFGCFLLFKLKYQLQFSCWIRRPSFMIVGNFVKNLVCINIAMTLSQ